MSTCPKCSNPIPTHSRDPRNTSLITYCPHCDAKLTHNHKEEVTANMHFTLFIIVTFTITFFLGNHFINSWGDNIALVAIPPILITLLYTSYRIFSVELEHISLEEEVEVLEQY